ncbi:MAG: His-Xaa-Ser system radical SAM maturase HxsC [Flavobacteriales bacterium]
MRTVDAKNTTDISSRTICTTLPIRSLASSWSPNKNFLVLVTEDDIKNAIQLMQSELGNIYFCCNENINFPERYLNKVIITGGLEDFDVVVLSPNMNHIQVLLRKSDSHHTVFLTNRCNSNCLMCSQPPTKHDDSWLVEEAKTIARHTLFNPDIIGFTGGEPTLLGEQLGEIIEIFHQYLPNTVFDILTNGRLLGHDAYAEQILAGLKAPVSWMVPLYGHADFVHDFMVQSKGAFSETLNGLLNLHQYRQSIQLRVVLTVTTLKNLEYIAEFIIKNLPFVREVALMGCEPIGFALSNIQECNVDITEYSTVLERVLIQLDEAKLRPILMNMPLCLISELSHKYAAKSISDWKQKYEAECEGCALLHQCSGVFAWDNNNWMKPKLKNFHKESVI